MKDVIPYKKLLGSGFQTKLLNRRENMFQFDFAMGSRSYSGVLFCQLLDNVDCVSVRIATGTSSPTPVTMNFWVRFYFKA